MALEAEPPMTDLVRTRPESFFSDRFSITSDLMERVLGGNLIGKVDDADIYLEYRINEDLVLEEGAVKKASRHVSQGAGVRAQSGERTGYAHTDDLSLPNLEEAARQARAIADQASASSVVAVGPHGAPHDLYTLAGPPIAADLDRPGSSPWCWARDGRASCSTKRWGTGSRATSTASGPRPSPGVSARRSPPSWSPWWTTAPSRTGAARSTWTTRVSRRPATSSSR